MVIPADRTDRATWSETTAGNKMHTYPVIITGGEDTGHKQIRRLVQIGLQWHQPDPVRP